MDVVELKRQLTEILPLLNHNFEKAYEEYMKGSLSNGAMNVVNRRLLLVSHVINSNDGDYSDVDLFQMASTSIIDLRFYVEHEGIDHKSKLEKLLTLYKSEGFLMHPIFEYPVFKPDNNVKGWDQCG